jgi:hypothetical protein
MAAKATVKSLDSQVHRLNQQVCTLMAYLSHLEQLQKVGVEERFVEAEAKKLLREHGSGVTGNTDYVRETVSYVARGQPEPFSA